MRQPGAPSPRRAIVQVQDRVYLNSGELTEEENKMKEVSQVIQLSMKLYDPCSVDKNTTIFTDQAVENVFSLLTSALDESNTPYQISEKSWKLTFNKSRTYDMEKQKPY